MPKTKTGEIISWKEFGERWKKGIENLTPLQKVQNDLRGSFVTMLGFIVSLVAVIVLREKIGLLAYGLILIFIGSVWTTGVKFFSLKQQKRLIISLEKQSKELDLQDVLGGDDNE